MVAQVLICSCPFNPTYALLSPNTTESAGGEGGEDPMSRISMGGGGGGPEGSILEGEIFI